MRETFFKFPSTPHLAVLPGVDVRSDKVFSEYERSEFLQYVVTVEEKIDGANLGISFDASGNLKAQNRGSLLNLPGSGQWKKLAGWLAERTDILFEHLSDRYVLFGEWCYARHSIFYNRLPDWFLAFDFYDRQSRRFLSTARRDHMIEKMRIDKVPHLATGQFSFSQIEKFLAESRLTDQPAEGIYLRIDSNDWLEKRAKLVRPEFIQAVEEHWSRSSILPNCIKP